ncbi:MAG: sigma-70 family RNA polymerase sigma factor [Tepidisphaeraceae bacterium]
MGDHPAQKIPTRASMFARLNDPAQSDAAWSGFVHNYGPVIAAFARSFGAGESDVDDIVQEVILGFHSASARFVYDPSKGSFRGYLRKCALNSLRERLGERARLDTVSLSALGDDAPQIEQIWAIEEDRHRFRRALALVKEEYRDSATVRAFEEFALGGRPAAEVASELGVSLDSVYQAKHRIKEALRKKIDELSAAENV